MQWKERLTMILTGNVIAPEVMRVIYANYCTDTATRHGKLQTNQYHPGILMNDKSYPPILDACCGSRSFWNDKSNPLAMFMDIRRETLELCDGRTIEVNPDVVADFRGGAFLCGFFLGVGVLPPPPPGPPDPHNAHAGSSGGRLSGRPPTPHP